MPGFGRWFGPRLPAAPGTKPAKSAETLDLKASCCPCRVRRLSTQVSTAISKLRRNSVLSPRARAHLRPSSCPRKTANFEILHVYCSGYRPVCVSRPRRAIKELGSQGTERPRGRPRNRRAACPQENHPDTFSALGRNPAAFGVPAACPPLLYEGCRRHLQE